MDIFNYIAKNNTEEAVNYAGENGVTEVFSVSDLANKLKKIFARGEEKAKEILNLHPDKAVILEAFQSTQEPIKPIFQKRNLEGDTCCSCMKNITGDSTSNNTNTNTSTNSSNIVSSTNTFIILGALIISVAVLSLKK